MPILTKKKYLLASGCSYTDPNFKSPDVSISDELRGPYTMWPKFLAEDLNLNVLNVGESGNSNTMIYRSILDAINKYEDKIDTVAVLWSGWDRTELFHYWKFQCLHYGAYYSEEKTEYDEKLFHDKLVDSLGLVEFYHTFKNSPVWNTYLFLRESTNQSLGLMQSLLEICYRRNIKCVFFQGVNPMDLSLLNKISSTITGNPHNIEYSNKHILEAFVKCSSVKFLEKNKQHIIGWPFFSDLGGYHFDSLRYSIKSTDQYWVSQKDHHPNIRGQKEISDHFLKTHRKIYA